MRNSPHSGLTVAALAASAVALAGVGCDSTQQNRRVTYTDPYGSIVDACMDEDGKIIPDDECPPEDPELNVLRAQIKDQAAQIDKLQTGIDTANAVCETACEDTEGGDSTPGGYEVGM